jgi:hypothetical protein
MQGTGFLQQDKVTMTKGLESESESKQRFKDKKRKDLKLRRRFF